VLSGPSATTTVNHRARARWLTLVVAFGTALVLAEGALRVASSLLPPDLRQAVNLEPEKMGVAHPYIGTLGTPNRTFVVSGRGFNAVTHVDALGFRNGWPWPARADVVVVGDSVAFGYGVRDEEAWPAIVAQRLPPVSVINLSIVGAGPQQYQRLYEVFGAKLHPKLLVVGLFPENDFWDAESFDEWEHSGAGGNYMAWRDFGHPRPLRVELAHPLRTAASIFDNRVYLLFRRSRLFNLVRMTWAFDERRRSIVQLSGGARVTLAISDFEQNAQLAKAGTPAFDLTLSAIERMRAICAAAGTRMLVVVQPGKEQVYLQPPLLADINGPLLEALRRDGIEYLDLTPVFRRRAEAGERLFRDPDGHPNEAGYALTAASIVERLDQNRSMYGLEP
jgi:GDSL-like Lipase/Acylhydrolase family